MKRIAVLIGLIWASHSLAASTTIAEWDLENAGNGVVSPLDLANHVTASPISHSGVSLLTGSGTEGVLVARNWATGAVPDPTKYFEFSMTLDPSASATLDALSLSLARGNYGGGHGAQTWQLSASRDGFLTRVDLATLDLSGSAYDEIVVFGDVDISTLGTVAGTVTFRLYGYDYSSGTQDYSGLAYRNDDLTGQGVNLRITGSVGSTSVPVPGAFLLSGLGLCLLGKVRRFGA